MRLQVDMSDEMMNLVNDCFRNKKPFIWKQKKYMIQSGGEFTYIGEKKVWYSDLVLIPIKNNKK